MAFNVPADSAADGNAAERLEGTWTGGDCPDVLTNLCTPFASFKLVLNRSTDAGDTGVEVPATERRLKHVQNIER